MGTQLTSIDIQPTTRQEALTSTEIENCATRPFTVNICGVEKGFQMNSGASMKNGIVKSSNIVHPKIIFPSASATKPPVNKFFNPSEYLHRLNPLLNSQEKVTTKEKTKSFYEQKQSK